MVDSEVRWSPSPGLVASPGSLMLCVIIIVEVSPLPCVLLRKNQGSRNENPREPRSPQLSVEKTRFLPKNFLCIEIPPLAQFSHSIRFTAQWVVSVRAKTSFGSLLDCTFWACCFSHGAVSNNQDWELRQKASMSL